MSDHLNIKATFFFSNSLVILWLAILFHLDIKKQKENNMTT